MTEKERQALAELLKARRAELGISARELARRAGVNNATITMLEQCKFNNPRIETVTALARALETPLADVYSVTNWLPEDVLPSLRPYMRAKYGELTDDDLQRVEEFVDHLSGHYRSGPAPGEDE